jgi:adenylylsulfate kinase
MVESNERNIAWQQGDVGRYDRARLLGHRGVTVWLTGLSGSGKSTIARRLERLLVERSVLAYVLDGDNVRHGLSRDLGFGPEQRSENIRRIAEVAKLFTDAGLVTLTAFISPYRADRAQARALLAPGDFLEIHCAATVDECEARDPKGLYARARAGEIPEFTGVSAPYEAPEHPELTLLTGQEPAEESARKVLAFLTERGYIPPAAA